MYQRRQFTISISVKIYIKCDVLIKGSKSALELKLIKGTENDGCSENRRLLITASIGSEGNKRRRGNQDIKNVRIIKGFASF